VLKIDAKSTLKSYPFENFNNCNCPSYSMYAVSVPVYKIFKPGKRRLARAWFLVITFVRESMHVFVYMCVCVCAHTRVRAYAPETINN